MGKTPAPSERRNAPPKTFGELIEAYQASGWMEKLNRTARAPSLGRIDRHLLPLIGKRTLDAITRKGNGKGLSGHQERATGRG